MKGRRRFWVLGSLILLWLGGGIAQGREEIWVLVDTEALQLQVMRGEKPVEVFAHIAIGRAGTAREKVRGDNKTPLGSFRIGWIKENSRYHRFFGLNYPTLPYAKVGWNHGVLDDSTFRSLIRAHFEESVPPQNTPLGGFIGIHGLGRADPKIHEMFNWTRGCIALTDAQIDRLSHWIGVGTAVIIR
ncbi:L,D-transpeptidase family protein [Methylohalobius crimeensis]|uniref:L,D-transpeptidase family protein n=1 Tax=Methylohalobius crimeensis TaxID=244365 RepID=UPI0003B55C1E|nr:L,D-transpeptidase [Methylohalobius crimeensis]